MSPAQAETSKVATDIAVNNLAESTELELSPPEVVEESATTLSPESVDSSMSSALAKAVFESAPSSPEISEAIAVNIPSTSETAITVPQNIDLPQEAAEIPLEVSLLAIAPEPKELENVPTPPADEFVENTELIAAAVEIEPIAAEIETESELAELPLEIENQEIQEPIVIAQGAPNEARVLVAEIAINGIGGNVFSAHHVYG